MGRKSPAPKQKDVSPHQSPASRFMASHETVMDAAESAAYRVAEAENKSFLAAEAVKEAERYSKLADDTDSILQLAKDIYKQCTAHKQPYLLHYFFNHASITINHCSCGSIYAGSRGEIILLA